MQQQAGQAFDGGDRTAACLRVSGLCFAAATKSFIDRYGELALTTAMVGSKTKRTMRVKSLTEYFALALISVVATQVLVNTAMV